MRASNRIHHGRYHIFKSGPVWFCVSSDGYTVASRSTGREMLDMLNLPIPAQQWRDASQLAKRIVEEAL